jgi:hypothetical protein
MNTRRRALAGLKDPPVAVAKARITKKKIELGGTAGRHALMTTTTTAAVAVSTTNRPRRSTSAVVSVAVRLSSRIQSRGVDVAPRLLVPTRTKTTFSRLVRTFRLSRKHPSSRSPRKPSIAQRLSTSFLSLKHLRHERPLNVIQDRPGQRRSNMVSHSQCLGLATKSRTISMLHWKLPNLAFCDSISFFYNWVDCDPVNARGAPRQNGRGGTIVCSGANRESTEPATKKNAKGSIEAPDSKSDRSPKKVAGAAAAPKSIRKDDDKPNRAAIECTSCPSPLVSNPIQSFNVGTCHA